MTPDWYITRQGKRYGPFTEAKLRELVATKRLLRSDLVWRQGMGQWVAAGTVQSLFPIPEARPSGIGSLGSRSLASASVPETEMPIFDVGPSSRRNGGSKPLAKNANRTKKRGSADSRRYLIISGLILVVVPSLVLVLVGLPKFSVTTKDRVVATFKKRVASMLKNPASAKFDELVVKLVVLPDMRPVHPGGEKAYVVKAMVYGTNTFGGVVGSSWIGIFAADASPHYIGTYESLIENFSSDRLTAFGKWENANFYD